jgi:hypothetical protein
VFIVQCKPFSRHWKVAVTTNKSISRCVSAAASKQSDSGRERRCQKKSEGWLITKDSQQFKVIDNIK